MSFYQRRTVFDGLYNIFRNIPPSALSGISVRTEYFTTQTGVAVPHGPNGEFPIYVLIEALIGPGGGGASGCRWAAASVRCGGGGGGSGASLFNYKIDSGLLGSTFTLILPAAGIGGAAVTTDSTYGNAGGIPGNASFSSGSFTVQDILGGAAVGGTNTLGTGGVQGQGQNSGSPGGSASVTGGVGAAGGGNLLGGPGGGGAGGGITSADSASNGGTGGPQVLQYGFTAVTGGVVGGASPGAGNAAVAGVGGQGAGGGAASITGAAQSGATPTGYGAGGGGGGASLNGNNSGAGGNGGGPYCRLRWVYA